MANTTLIERAPQVREIDPRLMGGLAVAAELAPEAAFASVVPAENLSVPNFLGGPNDRLVVPSVAVETRADRRGVSYEARLVDLHGSHPTLDALYKEALRDGGRGAQRRLMTMAYATAARVLPNVGANGLHHIYDTAFGTVFYPVNTGLHPYVAQVGRLGAGDAAVPVLAMIGATNSAAAEHKLWKLIGSAHQDRKRR